MVKVPGDTPRRRLDAFAASGGKLCGLALGIGWWLLSSSMDARAQQAAEAYFDAAEMAAARSALEADHGDQSLSLVLVDRFEYHFDDVDSNITAEGQGWIGGDIRKFWFKAEGEYATETDRSAEMEFQTLFSRAVSPFWNLQVGIRHDIEPDSSRSHAAIGVQGLAPYWFELDAALFFSDRGHLSARLEAEYEFRLNQRLLLQPRVELNTVFAADEVAEAGSGPDTAEAGLRLRYEFAREFAPYVGVAWERSLGDTAMRRRAEGEDTDRVSVVAGVRFWF